MGWATLKRRIRDRVPPACLSTVGHHFLGKQMFFLPFISREGQVDGEPEAGGAAKQGNPAAARKHGWEAALALPPTHVYKDTRRPHPSICFLVVKIPLDDQAALVIIGNNSVLCPEKRIWKNINDENITKHFTLASKISKSACWRHHWLPRSSSEVLLRTSEQWASNLRHSWGNCPMVA